MTSRDYRFVIDSLLSDCDPNVSCLGKRLTTYVDSKRFEMVVDEFWTSPYEFSKMQGLNKPLYDKLSQAAIAIFKGDLNHRKLLADKNRPVDTDFKTALEGKGNRLLRVINRLKCFYYYLFFILGFLPTAVCTLRTIKCDVMCGIEQTKFDAITSKHEGEGWMGTGEYAVIQCAMK